MTCFEYHYEHETVKFSLPCKVHGEAVHHDDPFSEFLTCTSYMPKNAQDSHHQILSRDQPRSTVVLKVGSEDPQGSRKPSQGVHERFPRETQTELFICSHLSS